mmetsp:Transcript_30868/g.49937  ORF Transcript_30868/g.49937 Transcript_30868/m.49937 type:complete len:96 (-) Transcript_30868:365-652(-)
MEPNPKTIVYFAMLCCAIANYLLSKNVSVQAPMRQDMERRFVCPALPLQYPLPKECPDLLLCGDVCSDFGLLSFRKYEIVEIQQCLGYRHTQTKS